MKVKAARVSIALLLLATVALATDDRFKGGAYDGWASSAMTNSVGLGGIPVWLSSGVNQSFSWTAPSLALATVTVWAEEPMATITNGGILRVSVPTLWQCRFDTHASVALGGGASGKVLAASYSGDGRSLLIPVANDFVDGDILTVSGLRLTDLRLAREGAQRLALDFMGDDTPDVSDASTLAASVVWQGGSSDGWGTVTSDFSVFWIPKGLLISVN